MQEMLTQVFNQASLGDQAETVAAPPVRPQFHIIEHVDLGKWLIGRKRHRFQFQVRILGPQILQLLTIHLSQGY